MKERKTITFKGAPLTLLGEEIQIGDKAPTVTLTANDLKKVSFSFTPGKVTLLASVPSLDTPTCDLETRTFNEQAEKIGNHVEIVTVSMDLPFAQKRWCGAHGISHITTYSDYQERSFGEKYGVMIKELGLLSRALFVVDSSGIIRYKQYVKEISEQPNYDEVLAALKSTK